MSVGIFIFDGENGMYCDAFVKAEDDTKLLYAYPAAGNGEETGLSLYFRSKDARAAGINLIMEAVQRGEHYLKLVPHTVKAAK